MRRDVRASPRHDVACRDFSVDILAVLGSGRLCEFTRVLWECMCLFVRVKLVAFSSLKVCVLRIVGVCEVRLYLRRSL